MAQGFQYLPPKKKKKKKKIVIIKYNKINK